MTRGRGVGVAALVLFASLTGGCGNGVQDYCGALSADNAVFVDDGTGVGLLNHLPELKSLAGRAPDDLTAQWQIVLRALQGLHDAITKAGLRPGQFVNGNPPASVSASARASIAAAASQVSQPDVVDAFNGIDQEAKDVCKLQLGL
jgi:hypothetical protein